jgi:hypothetical protein
MDYDENDGAEEAYLEHMEQMFRRDHGDEIADEITTGEVIAHALDAHRKWWIPAQHGIDKSRKRLEDREFEESLFHIGRAFDGYSHNVLVKPLRAAVVERFLRSMPAKFQMKEGAIFRSVNGIGSGQAFAEYTLSLIAETPANAEVLIGEMHGLFGGADGASGWDIRNRAFHAPISVPENVAMSILERAEVLLKKVAGNMERLAAAEAAEREKHEFSVARLETLHSLAMAFDQDRKTDLEPHDIARSRQALESQHETLCALVSLGYVEALRATPPSPVMDTA